MVKTLTRQRIDSIWVGKEKDQAVRRTPLMNMPRMYIVKSSAKVHSEGCISLMAGRYHAEILEAAVVFWKACWRWVGTGVDVRDCDEEERDGLIWPSSKSSGFSNQ